MPSIMHAVVRETFYPPSQPIQDTNEFQEFQALHAARKGYKGTVVVDAGAGRLLTMTIWETPADAEAARLALEPAIERLLDALMTAPAKLVGTGPVVVNDLTS